MRLVHVEHLHLHCDGQEEIVALLKQLLEKGKTIMATVQELAQAVADMKAAVAAVPQAINDLEAKVTAALAAAGLTPEQQAAVDQAFADAKAATADVNAAVADAGDGVDEGAATGEVSGANPA